MEDIVLDQAILDKNLDVVYDLFFGRTAFGKDQAERIKTKVNASLRQLSGRDYMTFGDLYEDYVLKKFRCSFVDEYLVLQRNRCVPVTFEEFLFYFQRTSLKGIRTIPEYPFKVEQESNKIRGFCLQRKGDSLKFIPTRAEHPTSIKVVSDAVSEGTYTDTTFARASRDLRKYKKFLEKFFNPKGKTTDVPIKKLYPWNVLEVFGEMGPGYSVILIPGFDGNGEYLLSEIDEDKTYAIVRLNFGKNIRYSRFGYFEDFENKNLDVDKQSFQWDPEMFTSLEPIEKAAFLQANLSVLSESKVEGVEIIDLGLDEGGFTYACVKIGEEICLASDEDISGFINYEIVSEKYFDKDEVWLFYKLK